MHDPTPGPDELEEEIAESDLKLDHDGVVHPDHADARQKQQQHTMSGTRWATRPATFTAAQYEELEQQALIYKYLVAGVPVPPDLRLPIRRGFDSLASCFYHHHAQHK
ncbi:growth-regulating factor 3 isoform X4 [Triticum aestivum]|uniref:growth-regulating factor 3 isoform X4 n=1 Tax=Triticum aestivum TaxID=4565 RepID=UPI001D0346FA|nr:growth-regulating factor 3-like isoform X4 [Triticum aestivum]